MKLIKNFFKLFLETFAWIMVLAVISLFIIRVIEKFVVLDNTWQICIICAVQILLERYAHSEIGGTFILI